MTISVSENSITFEYSGGGDFSFEFPYTATEDIIVIHRTNEGIITSLDDYNLVTIKDGVNYIGGTVQIVNSSLPVGTLTISREIEIAQLVSLINNSALDLKIIERAFDKLTLILQDFNIKEDMKEEIVDDKISYAISESGHQSAAQVIAAVNLAIANTGHQSAAQVIAAINSAIAGVSTDLSVNPGTTNVTLQSSSGNDAVLLAAHAGGNNVVGRAGVMSQADKGKLNTIASGAQVNDPNPPPVNSASETEEGIIELATQTETNAGTDPLRAITPSTLGSRIATPTRRGIVELATTDEVDAGTDTVRAVTSASLVNIRRARSRWIGHYGCPSPFETYTPTQAYGNVIDAEVPRPFLFGEDIVNVGDEILVTLASSKPADADDITTYVGNSVTISSNNSYFSLSGLFRLTCIIQAKGLDPVAGVTIGLYRVNSGFDTPIAFASVGGFQVGILPSIEVPLSATLHTVPIIFNPTDIYYVLFTLDLDQDVDYTFNGHIQIEEI